jgi:hypothetical protein
VRRSPRPRTPSTESTPVPEISRGAVSSIDGVVESPDQWQPAFDDEMGAAMGKQLDEQDTVLLGRVTFEERAGYWPPKFVASTTLTSVDGWQHSTLTPATSPRSSLT